MSSLSLHDLQGISTYSNTIRIPSGHRLDMQGTAKLPTWTDATKPGSPAVGDVGYNTSTATLEFYDGEDWLQIISSVKDGSSVAKAANSAQAIKDVQPICYFWTLLYYRCGSRSCSSLLRHVHRRWWLDVCI